MVKYSIEIGKNRKWAKRNVRFHDFDKLSDVKKFTREKLGEGHAVSVNKLDRYGEFQPIATFGDLKKRFNFSRIGRITPLKQKVRRKLRAKRSAIPRATGGIGSADWITKETGGFG